VMAALDMGAWPLRRRKMPHSTQFNNVSWTTVGDSDQTRNGFGLALSTIEKENGLNNVIYPGIVCYVQVASS
jgi:hypothetical protein